jgi:hypothetical protein
LFLIFALVGAACGDDSGGDGTANNTANDTGTNDAGTEDTGTEDSGTEDSGTEDSGTEDSGTEDTGSEDSGTQDTGTEDTGEDTVEATTFTSQTALADAAGTLTTIDFEDVTVDVDPVPIESNRYASQGVMLTGDDGQYVHDAFSYPDDYVAVSGSNMFAPGPASFGGTPGSPTTVVTFTTGDSAAATSAFGVYFIDADYPDRGQSRLIAYAADDSVLADVPVSSASGEAAFAGLVTTDAQGAPVAAITRVELVTGNGWPGSADAEGVVLDDLMLGAVE